MADTGGGGGGQTRPMPPLTNKDTPPVHCNEFNYKSSARTVLALAGARLLSNTPDTWHFFYCAFERSVRTFVQRSVRTFVQHSVRTFVQRSVRTLRISISIAVRKVVDQTQRNNVPARSPKEYF